LYQPRNIQRNARKFYAERRFVASADMQPEQGQRLVEALRQGSAFTTTLTFGNLVQEEFSLLLHALGVPRPHTVKLGGAKPRSFGSVHFAPTRLTLWHDPLAEPERKEGSELEQFVGQVCSATALVQEELLRGYQHQVAAEADQPAPRGVY
jgi:hypothetical protein